MTGGGIVTIDGRAFDVPVIKLERQAEFLDKYAERVQSGELKRELIGVYYNYSLELGATSNKEEYHALWDKLTEPKEFHQVTLPDNMGMYTFTAYIAGVKDGIIYAKGSNRIMDGLTCDFIAKAPARRA